MSTTYRDVVFSPREREKPIPFLIGARVWPVATHGYPYGGDTMTSLPMGETPLTSEDGAATAEYAIATMAAVGFAGLLVVIMRSEEVRTILTDLVRSALTFTG